MNIAEAKGKVTEKGFLDIEIDVQMDLFSEIERLKKEKNAIKYLKHKGFGELLYVKILMIADDKEGFIDVLINNAGVSSLGAVEELPLEAFKKDMETNYFGTLRCIKAVLPLMRERREGTIINISSVAGKVYSNFHCTYAPTKAAVEALSECLAQEVQPFGIRVALVEPGVIETPIFSKGYKLTEKTNYPNIKRFLAFFAASVDNHVSPDEVAIVIGDIIKGHSNKFRNTAGPDAAPLIEWRASQKDEDWIASTSIDNETWITGMEQGMHLNVRPYMEDSSLINFETTTPVSIN